MARTGARVDRLLSIRERRLVAGFGKCGEGGRTVSEVPGVTARSRDGSRLLVKPPGPDDLAPETLEDWCVALIELLRPDEVPVDGEGGRGG